jgi:hypothetical protein
VLVHPSGVKTSDSDTILQYWGSATSKRYSGLRRTFHDGNPGKAIHERAGQMRIRGVRIRQNYAGTKTVHQPWAFAKPVGQCHRGQPALPIAVDSHIDDAGDSLNDGITSRRS